MRIADQSGCYFTITRIETDPQGRGDIRAKVDCAGNGFSGANKSVWFDRIEIDRFVSELRALDQSREGSTTLETLSPGECVLAIRNVDQLGHVHLDVSIARAVSNIGKTDHFRCRLIIEVDPTSFGAIIDELDAELAA